MSQPGGGAGSGPRVAGLVQGKLVISADGAVLGEVAEFNGAYFRVDVQFRQDLWFGMDLVADATGQVVRLRVSEQDALQAGRETAPGDTPPPSVSG